MKKQMTIKSDYRERQIAKVLNDEYLEYLPKIKIVKPNGETNWLEITQHELERIAKILINGVKI